MVQDVDLATQRLGPTFHLQLRVVQLVVLRFDDSVLLLHILLFHLELANLVVTVRSLEALIVGRLDLVVELHVVALKFSVAALKLVNAAVSIEAHILELLLQLLFLHALSVSRSASADQVLRSKLVLSAVLLLLSEADLKSLVDAHLDEILETLVRLDLELDVLLFGAHEAACGQLLLVELELLLEGGQLIHHHLL